MRAPGTYVSALNRHGSPRRHNSADSLGHNEPVVGNDHASSATELEHDEESEKTVPKILRRPRARSLVAAMVGGGLVLGMAAPAHANYISPKFKTKAACNAARPTYVSSWTSPGPCLRQYDDTNGKVTKWWDFIVTTRY